MSGGIGSRGAIGEPEAADSGRARWLRLSRFRQYWREKLTTFGSKVHAPLREGNRVALYEDGGNVLEACRTRTDPAVTGEAGRAALKLALDVQEEVRRRLG